MQHLHRERCQTASSFNAEVLTSSERGHSLAERSCSKSASSPSRGQEALGGVSGRGAVGAGGGGVLVLPSRQNILSRWVMRNSTSTAW